MTRDSSIAGRQPPNSLSHLFLGRRDLVESILKAYVVVTIVETRPLGRTYHYTTIRHDQIWRFGSDVEKMKQHALETLKMEPIVGNWLERQLAHIVSQQVIEINIEP